MGEKGGRTDMDRVGLFQEMGYVTINDKYKERGGKLSSAIYFEAFFILKQFLNLDIRIYMCIYACRPP